MTCQEWKDLMAAALDQRWREAFAMRTRLDEIQAKIADRKSRVCDVNHPQHSEECCQLITEFESANLASTANTYDMLLSAIGNAAGWAGQVNCQEECWCHFAIEADQWYQEVQRWFATFQAAVEFWQSFLDDLAKRGCGTPPSTGPIPVNPFPPVWTP